MKYLKDLSTGFREFAPLPNGARIQDVLRSEAAGSGPAIREWVAQIRDAILRDGDETVMQCTLSFDRALIVDPLVTDGEFAEAERLVDDAMKDSIRRAIENVRKFHEREIPKDMERGETSPGVTCWREFRPIESVGLYVPGWRAPLFSSVLMLGIPATIAGCRNVSICTPPGPDGKIAPEILYCASVLGIRNIYKAWGAQAIFALAYGTSNIPKVDKIFGPGNAHVTEAKSQASGLCAIDMPAGPSEVLVIADSSANPAFVAADLLSQCEHGPDSQSVLVSDSRILIERTLSECLKQHESLPKKDVAQKSLARSFAVQTESVEESIEVSNGYAPEHLILQIRHWKDAVAGIMHAWSVFCGPYSPESAGDYASGTNHTLPTNGFAKSFSGVGVESFGKWVTFQELSEEGLRDIGTDIENMARREGLEAHARAVGVRMGRAGN